MGSEPRKAAPVALPGNTHPVPTTPCLVWGVSTPPIPPGTVWAELSATVRAFSGKGSSRAGVRTYLM